MNMQIIVALELDAPYELTLDKIEKDLKMAEDQIGWDYYYRIKSVELKGE